MFEQHATATTIGLFTATVAIPIVVAVTFGLLACAITFAVIASALWAMLD